jgi:hypothetical protein
VFGTFILVALGTIAASSIPQPRPRQPDTLVGALEILIGAALIGLGSSSLRRLREKVRGSEPVWSDAVGAFGAGRSLGLGLVLNVRPKGLLLCAAASLAVHSANDSFEVSAVLVVAYTVIATSTVALPILATLISPRSMEPRLIAARTWLDENGSMVTASIMMLIGVLVAGYGITNL